MTIEELEKIISVIGNLGAGVIFGAIVSYLLFKNFLPAYFTDKAKNLATKEDIGSITNEVESVKSEYVKVIEELKNINQLKFAEIEREKNIKKEVYLEAIEALTKAQNIVTNLANLNIDDQVLADGMANDSGKIAKVQIVGSENTVKSVMTIMSAIATAYLELMLERTTLIVRKNRIANLQDLRSKAQKEIEHCITLMIDLNLEGNQEKHKWDTINRNIEFQTKTRDDYGQEVNGLIKEQNFEHLVFSKKCVESYFQTASLYPDAVLAVREELNLTIPNEAYLDIYNKNIELGKQVFSTFFNRATNKLEELHSSLGK